VLRSPRSTPKNENPRGRPRGFRWIALALAYFSAPPGAAVVVRIDADDVRPTVERRVRIAIVIELKPAYGAAAKPVKPRPGS
jgi:hypothetical protein